MAGPNDQPKKISKTFGSPEWYVEVEKSQVGPYTPEEIEILNTSGILKSGMKIFHPVQAPGGISWEDFRNLGTITSSQQANVSTEIRSAENQNTSENEQDKTRVAAVMEAFEATKIITESSALQNLESDSGDQNGLTEVVSPPPPPDSNDFSFPPSIDDPASRNSGMTGGTPPTFSGGTFSPPPRPQIAPEGTGLIRVPSKDGGYQPPLDPATQLFEAVQLAKEKKASLKAIQGQRLEDLSLQAYSDSIQEKKSRWVNPQLFTLIAVVGVFNLALWGIWGLMTKVDPKTGEVGTSPSLAQGLTQKVQSGFDRLTGGSSSKDQNRAPATADNPAEKERKRLEKEKRELEERLRKERQEAERKIQEERRRRERLEREEKERDEREREQAEREREKEIERDLSRDRDEPVAVDDPVKELEGPSSKKKDRRESREPRDRDSRTPLDPNELLNEYSHPDQPNPIE